MDVHGDTFGDRYWDPSPIIACGYVKMRFSLVSIALFIAIIAIAIAMIQNDLPFFVGMPALALIFAVWAASYSEDDSTG